MREIGSLPNEKNEGTKVKWKDTYRKNREPKELILEKKLHKVDLTAIDIQDILGLQKDKFDDWLRRMCELYEGLEVSIFKEGKYFKLKPEWHSYFLVLFGSIDEHPKFNRNPIRQRETIDAYNKYFEKIKVNMDQFMKADERLTLEGTSAYIKSDLEVEWVNKFETQLLKLRSKFNKVRDDDLRLELLLKLNNWVELINMELETEIEAHKFAKRFDEQGMNEIEKKKDSTLTQSFPQMVAIQLEILAKGKTDDMLDGLSKEWARDEDGSVDLPDEIMEKRAFVNAMWQKLILATKRGVEEDEA